MHDKHQNIHLKTPKHPTQGTGHKNCRKFLQKKLKYTWPS
jgi:hypothetical protein